MTKVLGITGGVGAGKSTILDYLKERYHACVILADEVGKQLQMPGEWCFAQIAERFGTSVLQVDGNLDRKVLASLVFRDEKELSWLNGLMHPAIKQKIISIIQEYKKQERCSMIVLEAALLLEDHYDQMCDEVWYIYTDREVRTARLQRDRGYSIEKINNIIANQLSDQMYRTKCNLVIDNSADNVENTYDQIDKGLKEHGFL